jgi:hypothetical protein
MGEGTTAEEGDDALRCPDAKRRKKFARCTLAISLGVEDTMMLLVDLSGRLDVQLH